MAWYRRFVVCWESFVPGGPIGAACWESFIPVRPAGFRAGRVSSRSSGETARSEGVRGLRGMYLRCRRAAARLESGARPAGPGRASRRRAERSSRRGRRAGGQASRRTEVWRGAPSEARWDGGCGAGGHGRPIGGWCEACRAWPGFEATRRAKLAARSASGRAGLAPHGRSGGVRHTEVWRLGASRTASGRAGLAPHGDLAGCAIVLP